MYAFLNKYGQALAFGIGVLVTLIFLVSIFTMPEEQMTMLSDENAGAEKYATTAFDFGLYGSIFLTVIAFVVALVFGIGQLASNPKGSVKGLLGLAALLVVVFISYSVANNDISQESAEIQRAIEKFNTDQEANFDGGTLKFVSGSIIASVVLIGLSILSLIVFGIRGIFK